MQIIAVLFAVGLVSFVTHRAISSQAVPFPLISTFSPRRYLNTLNEFHGPEAANTPYMCTLKPRPSMPPFRRRKRREPLPARTCAPHPASTIIDDDGLSSTTEGSDEDTAPSWVSSSLGSKTEGPFTMPWSEVRVTTGHRFVRVELGKESSPGQPGYLSHLEGLVQAFLGAKDRIDPLGHLNRFLRLSRGPSSDSTQPPLTLSVEVHPCNWTTWQYTRFLDTLMVEIGQDLSRLVEVRFSLPNDFKLLSGDSEVDGRPRCRLPDQWQTSLRRFEWKGNVDSVPHPWYILECVPFHDLTHITLKCRLSIDDCFGILHFAHLVEEFELDYIIKKHPVMAFSRRLPSGKVKLNHLKSLRITSADSLQGLLRKLTMVNLKRIHLTLTEEATKKFSLDDFEFSWDQLEQVQLHCSLPASVAQTIRNTCQNAEIFHHLNEVPCLSVL